MAMEFSELNEDWRPIPPWVEFLIRLGHGWPNQEQQLRRIALISMPGDSAAAGLIALGALIRDLANPRANDVEGHYDRLLEYARQYVHYCCDCSQRCCPEARGCGYAAEVSGRVRSQRGQLYTVSEKTDFAMRRLGFARGNIIEWPNPNHLVEWHIDGEPPAQLTQANEELSSDRYSRFVKDPPIHSENLRKTYSGLCFAGRAGGEAASLDVCQAVRFRIGTDAFGLDDALTIHGWSDCEVSRVAFFNVRTGNLDRNVSSMRLVVADGDASFLNVVDRPEFRKGDVVGVIHRIMERDRLEAVGNKMSALRQWYVPDEDMLCELPAVPRGTSISILRRRT